MFYLRTSFLQTTLLKSHLKTRILFSTSYICNRWLSNLGIQIQFDPCSMCPKSNLQGPRSGAITTNDFEKEITRFSLIIRLIVI